MPFLVIFDLRLAIVKSLFCLPHLLCEYSLPASVTEFHARLSIAHDVVSGSEKTPCNKIDKPLVVYRFLGNITCMN